MARRNEELRSRSENGLRALHSARVTRGYFAKRQRPCDYFEPRTGWIPSLLPRSPSRQQAAQQLLCCFDFFVSPGPRPFFFSRFLLVWFRKRQERVVCVARPPRSFRHWPKAAASASQCVHSSPQLCKASSACMHKHVARRTELSRAWRCVNMPRAAPWSTRRIKARG